MHRRRFLASILATAVAACTRHPRKAPISSARKPSLRERRLALGFDPGAPEGDSSALAIVEMPPRHAMTSHAHVQRIEVLGVDPDAWASELAHKLSGRRSA